MTQLEKNMFIKIAALCANKPREIVGSVLLNCLANAIKEQSLTVQVAEKVWDNAFGLGKQMLMTQYDQVSGKRIDQRIILPFKG